MTMPSRKPKNPCFSSGPCAKRPGWSAEALSDALLGRSHRSGPGKAKLKEAIELHKETLGIPADYKVGIVPASDTGAVEMAMWSMLGATGVDMVAWESFGSDWVKDAKALGIDSLNEHKAAYGEIVDLSAINQDNDVVFTWNGTTSGVRVPNGDWIKDDRKGLMICDATSAVFAYDMPWEKLDVVTWSWQKVLGGEAAHGMIVLSPRAVERLETYTPPRALPKIFQMAKNGKLNAALFEGATINTPSMLAVEDCLDALKWVKNLGGAKATIDRSKANLDVIEKWVSGNEWIDFLPVTEDIRSRTSICLKIVTPDFIALSDEDQQAFIKKMVKTLDQEGVAYDIAAYRDAPAGLRIWGGATVEASDLEILTEWINWAYQQTLSGLSQAAA